MPDQGFSLSARTLATATLSLALLAGLAVVPLFAPRAVVQDLFTVLTLLVLAMNWNMLAGFAGLVSVGQQAFVGIGAYAMFGAVILGGVDPLVGILIGGLAAMVLAVPMAFFAFRLNGAYFAIGTWAVADITRLAASQWKALGAALNPEWQILAGHVAFVAVLLLRPRGLFPRAQD